MLIALGFAVALLAEAPPTRCARAALPPGSIQLASLTLTGVGAAGAGGPAPGSEGDLDLSVDGNPNLSVIL